MHKLMKATLKLLDLLVIFVMTFGSPMSALAQDPLPTPTIQSDKLDYAPGELVTLTGTGWQGDSQVRIFVNDDIGRTWSRDVIIDAALDGSIVDMFNLPSWFVANYVVSASGQQTGRTAATTFTDLNVGTYDQCSNDDGDGYGGNPGVCQWINGNLQRNNSIYMEGDATVQRVWLTDLAPGSTHSVTLKYGTTKGGKHAYDFLTTWNWSEDWITLDNLCAAVTGQGTIDGCTTAAQMTYPIPDDPNLTNTIEAPAGDGRLFTMAGGSITAASTPVIVSGAYSADSETVITINYTVGPADGSLCSTKGDTTTCGIMLWFGAHVSVSGQWKLYNGTTGAGNISGSPYHVALDKVDSAAVGQRDNQMQAEVITYIPNGTIVLVKDAVPNAPRDFGFNLNNNSTIDFGTFYMDDDADPVLPNTLSFDVPPGTWYASELLPLPEPWSLTNLVCVDPTSNTTVDLAAGTATINLASLETVTCTFTNTKGSHIIVEKVTQGGDASFEFDPSWGANFNLSNGQAQDSGPLSEGTYSVAEVTPLPTGWTLFSAVCSDGSPVNAISLQAGETVTCTFTNTRDLGTLTIAKELSNPDGATVPASFLVGYDCGVGYTGQVSVVPGTPVEVTGIPTGTSCTVTEVAPDPITGYTWGAITYSPAQQIIIADTTSLFQITVGNSITRDTGGLKIKKTLSNPDGAPVPASYLVDYDCGTGYTGQASIGAGSPAIISGIPTGSSCTVTEVAPNPIPGYTWGTITYTPASVTIGAKGETVIITVGNSITRDLGNLEIVKELSNPDGAPVPVSYLVDYDCGTGYTGQASVGVGSPAIISGIPTGSSCTVTEVAPNPIPGYTWGTITYTPASVTIDTKGGTFTITFANSITRDRGNLKLKKTLVGGPVGYVGPFQINYDCGEGFTGFKMVEAGSDAIVTGIPTGTSCTISETLPTPPQGYVFGTPTFDPSATVLITDKDVTVRVTTANKMGQDLSVTKTAVPTFTRTWDWTITKEADATYNLFAGQGVTHGYRVTVNPVSTDSAWTVTGVITITNPNAWAVDASLSDAVDNGGTCVVDNGVVTVPPGGSVDVGYSCTWEAMPTSYTGNNTATLTWDAGLYTTPHGTASGGAGFEFTNPTEIKPVITVDDSNLTGETWSADRAHAEWTYTRDFSCSANPDDYTDGKYSYSLTNTAKINETGQTDTAKVDVNCYVPVVSKTAKGTYDERHDWDVTKSVTPVSQSAFAGDTVTYTWTIVVTEDVTEENFRVGGNITVVNPAPMEMVVDLVDKLGGGAVAAIGTCTGGTYGEGKLSIPANTTAVCAYTADPGGRTDTINNVTVMLNGIAFDASKTFNWAANVIGGSATLDDDQNPALPGELTEGGTFTYQESYTCSTDKTSYDAMTHKYSFGEDNTATLTSGTFSDSSSASTAVDCYVPGISKDASGGYDEVHDWEVFKSVNTASQTAFAGEKKNFTWTVRVDETTHGEGYLVTGKITVVNPNPEDALTIGLSDKLDDGSVATIGPCSGGTWSSPNLTVPAGGTATCDYTVTPKGDMARFAAALPATVTINSANPGPDSYWLTTVKNDGALNGVYEAWCVDIDHTMNPSTDYTATVYSSYESYPTSLIEKYNNMDLVNWIINQNFVGQPAGGSLGNYTYGDVQRAIWELIEDNPTYTTAGLGAWNQTRVNQIKAAATAGGEGFTPTCGDFVAVLLVPTSGQQPIAIAQVTFASLGISCADSNVATAVLNGVKFPASAQILWTVNKINETATLDDDQKLDWPTTVSADTTFTYQDPQGYTCSSNPAAYTNGYYQYNESNTAVLTYQTGSDTATASTAVKCYAPIVTKTAAGAYNERHEWEVEKSVTPLSQDVLAGSTGLFEWTVTVTESVFDENFAASGTISVKNPRPDNGNMTVKLSDMLSDGFVPAITGCTGGTWDAVNRTVAVPPNTTAICSYTASLSYDDEAKAPTLNTVTAELLAGTTHLVTTASDAIEWTANVIRGSATLDDDQNPVLPQGITDGGTWTYEDSYTCSTTKTDYINGSYTHPESNTATVTSGNKSDSSSANTQVICHAPVVAKDVTTYFNRDWDWTITKDYDGTYDMFAGASVTHGYRVAVAPTHTDSGWGVKGSITITNSHPTEDMLLTSVSDLAGGINAVVTCDSLTVPAAGSLTCTYDTGPQASPNLNPFGSTNKATAIFAAVNWTGTAPIIFGAAPTTEDEPVITVDDNNLEGESWSADRAAGSWTYNKNFACPVDLSLYTNGKYSYSWINTATINETGQNDMAKVDVNCYAPASARVVKVTESGPEDIGQLPFTFELYNPDGTKVETKTLDAAGQVTFDKQIIRAGMWKIVEVLPAGWVSTDASLECSFTVGFWADAGKTFTCTFHNTERSRVKLLKWTQGVINPLKTWTFSIWQGTDGFGGTKLASSTTSGDLDGILEFNNATLNTYKAYTLCEESVPAGWTSFWQVDSNGDGMIDDTDAIVVPYNPNASDTPPQDIGNRCIDFGAGTGIDLLSAGRTLLFMANNTYPGGEPRTPGYWKNWNRVTGGGQAANADRNGGYMDGFWLLEDVLNPSIGGGITWDDILTNDTFIFKITKAAVAVDILDQRDVANPDLVADGAKHSSDAAYTLAMSLLAAQLNFGAGARTCDAAQDAALAGEQLLDKYNFNGTGTYLLNNTRSTKADYNNAISLAGTLDKYNNGLLCSGPAVSFVTPLDGDVVNGSLTLQVEAMDQVPVTKVEFFVDGVKIGEDTIKSDGWSIAWDSTMLADGSRTLKAVATNTLNQAGKGDVVITVDNVPDPVLPKMHVGNLSATTTKTKTGRWSAAVTVSIHDESHTGLAGVVVSFAWKDGVTATCTTGANGTCTITRTGIASTVLSKTLEVAGLTLSGYEYVPALNEKTSITINKP